MTPGTFFMIVAGVGLNAGAQLLIKSGVGPLGVITVTSDGLLPLAFKVLSQWQILLGLGCYVVSVGIWIVALSRVDVSIAYPMLSLGYVLNAAGAYWLFGEAVGLTRLSGLALILVGVFVTSQG